NLYGTTLNGGVGLCFLGCGTVFELSPVAGGGWTFKTLYAFKGGNDGAYPNSTLSIDAAGNLYGSSGGGAGTNCPNPPGCGVIFRLSPTASSGWTESVIYSFLGGTDGFGPRQVTLDSAGNVYGTTTQGAGGTCGFNGGCGTVFKLSTNGTKWKET